MCLKVDKERVGTTHSRCEIVIKRRIVYQESQRTILAVQLICYSLHIVESLINLSHSSCNIHSCKICCECLSIVKHIVCLVYHGRHILVQACHHGVEFLSCNSKVGCYGLYISHRLTDGRIGKNSIKARHNGIELRQHFFYCRNHSLKFSHSTFVDSSLDGITRHHALTRVVGKQKVHLYISHKVGNDFCRATLRNTQIVVYIKAYHYVAIISIVVFNGLHYSYLISICKDRIRSRQSANILKPHIVGMVGRKYRQTLEKVHSKEQYYYTSYSHKSYTYFLSKKFHVTYCF